MDKNKTSGTKEWASSNVNCYFGCSNNCGYCYAKNIAIHYNRKTKENWKEMIPNIKAIEKGYGKRNGRIMFPTSHDITLDDGVKENCFKILKKLLVKGNEILIVTKPRFQIIRELCKEFSEDKDKIQFRFTITSLNNETLKKWEPGAPPFKERYVSLTHAFYQGFKTSVSIEPFLDYEPQYLMWTLWPFVTESIWIGPMNNSRLNGLKENYSIENLSKIYEDLKEISKIRFKDAFLNKIQRGMKND